MHWFHFDPVRTWPITLANREKVSAPFCCRISLWTKDFSIFWRRQKSGSILHRQIRLQTPIEWVNFSDRWRIWNPQSLSQQPNKTLCHPSHPTDFLPPRDARILGGNVTRRNQGLSSNDQGRQRRENSELVLISLLFYFFSSLRRGDQSTVFCIEKRDPGNEVALGLRSSRDRLARKFTRRRGSLCDHICFLWFLEQLWRLKLNEIWKLWLWADASMSKMPLVDNSEAGDRSSFRLRRIGTPATFPGISDTFK